MRANGMLAGVFLTLCIAALGQARPQDVTTEIRVEKKTIAYPVEYEFSRTVGPGRLVKVRNGESGEVRNVYQVTLKDGKPVSKELLRSEKEPAVSALFYMGREGYQPSRHKFTRGRVLNMEATAYDPSPRTIGPGATGRTATGMKAKFGVVAVDPRVIPLGSLVYVEGYGFAIASDKGSAIKGNKIDLCYASRSTALAFGRRTVKVHVLRNP